MNQLSKDSAIAYRKIDKSPLILILDNIRSAINVGSVFRSADAFNIEKIYLCGITAVPPNREILKTALGATETVQWEYTDSALRLIRHFKEQEDTEVISIEQTISSVPLEAFVPSIDKRYVLILGNEVKGVSHDLIALSDSCVEIRQFGTKHSLNVAVAAGITLWELSHKIRLLTKIQ